MKHAPPKGPVRWALLAATVLALAAASGRLVRARGGAHAASLGAPSLERAFTDSTLARLTPTSDRRREAPEARPLQHSEAALRAALDALGGTVAAGDSRAASELVERFFADGAPAVEQLLEALGGGASGPGDVPALAVLLKAAVRYMDLDAAKLAPWTVGDLAEQCVALIGAAPHVPAALLSGLDELGPRTEPRHVLGLLDAFTTRAVGPALESQAPCLGLARLWARSMPPEVEVALLDLLAADGGGADAEQIEGEAGAAHGAPPKDPRGEDARRAQAAGMLLERDWRRFAPELARLLAGRDGQRPADGAGLAAGADFVHVVSARVVELPAEERGEYYATFAAEPRLAVAMAWQLAPEDARLALEHGRGDTLAPDARDLLELRAGGPGALASGQRLLAGEPLADPSGGPSELVERLVIGSWLASDLALGDDLTRALEPRFAARTTDSGRFWRLLGHDLGALEEHELVAGVVPWLERSAGERTPARERLLAAVRARLPGLRLE